MATRRCCLSVSKLHTSINRYCAFRKEPPQTQKIVTKLVALIDTDLEYSRADMAKILTMVYRDVTNNKTKKVKKFVVMWSAEKEKQ